VKSVQSGGGVVAIFDVKVMGECQGHAVVHNGTACLV